MDCNDQVQKVYTNMSYFSVAMPKKVGRQGLYDCLAACLPKLRL